MRGHLFIEAPSCAGKTTFKRAFPELVSDTDDAKDPALEPQLKLLRRAALRDPARWVDHNRLWHAAIRASAEELLVRQVVIAHSYDDLSVLFRYSPKFTLVAVVPDVDRYSRQVADRVSEGTATLKLVISSYHTVLSDIRRHNVPRYESFQDALDAWREQL